MRWTKNFTLYYTVFFIILSLAGISLLLFNYTHGNIANENFVIIYSVIWGFSFILGLFSLLWLFVRKDSFVNFDDYSLVKNPGIKLLIWGVVTILLGFVVSGVGQSLLPEPINPYSALKPLSSEILSTHTTGQNLFYIAFFPMMEEAMVYGLTLALAFGFLGLFSLLFKKNFFKSKLMFLGSGIFGAGISSALFSWAHGLSYGLDQSAYVSAFFFEFIMQILNLATGLFLSWLPHFVNNAIVVVSLGIGFVIGGSALYVYPLFKKKNEVS